MLLSDTRFVQLVQSQNIGLCFRPEIEMLKYSQAGGFNDRFSGYWMYWLFMNFWLPGNFFEQPCPWVEVFIVCRSWENSCTTKAKHHLESLRISEQISSTLTGFQLQKLYYEYHADQVSKHRGFLARMPKLENLINHKAKIITEIAWHQRTTVLRRIRCGFPRKF